MNIRRAGRKVVKNLHKGYGIYRIGFVNIYGEEDETELDAMNINDLERLWLSLCPEFECKQLQFRQFQNLLQSLRNSSFPVITEKQQQLSILHRASELWTLLHQSNSD